MIPNEGKGLTAQRKQHLQWAEDGGEQLFGEFKEQQGGRSESKEEEWEKFRPWTHEGVDHRGPVGNSSKFEVKASEMELLGYWVEEWHEPIYI